MEDGLLTSPMKALAKTEVRVTDDLELLLQVMPLEIRQFIEADPECDRLLEIVLDLGRTPEIRFPVRVEEVGTAPVSRQEIEHVVSRVGRFGRDNRAGIERTLHRISALRNRVGEIIGLTCRVGRAVFGTVDVVRDVIENGESILLLGRPGVGKTTLLREAARVLAGELGKRVVVVDTSNEIAGDGDVPHPGIGRARRMQVPSPDQQHGVMIEAVENHMPEVIVIDEISTGAETLAARTIAERGVQLIATAHGNTLANLLQNPTLADLVGGIHAVTLSDEEARRRGSQKTVLERKAPPTFDVVIEIQEKDRLAVHHNTHEVVDRLLWERPSGSAGLKPELRLRTAAGVEILSPDPEGEESSQDAAVQLGRRRRLRIFPYAVSRDKLERCIRELRAPAVVVQHLAEADVVLTLKAHERRRPQKLREAQMRGLRLHVLRSNTRHQVESFLRSELGIEDFPDPGEIALRQVEEALAEARAEAHPVELSPQDRHVRRLQHELVQRSGLVSESKGEEPYRRVVVYP